MLPILRFLSIPILLTISHLSMADYEVPAPELYVCSTVAYFNMQDAANAHGRYVSRIYPLFTHWWVRSIPNPMRYVCEADNGLPPGPSPPYNGISAGIVRFNNCTYYTGTGKKVIIGTGGRQSYVNEDGTLSVKCLIPSKISP